jgi:CMP/dCMP kinase
VSSARWSANSGYDDVRAQRRHLDEVAADRAVAVEAVKAALDRRDALDSGRVVSPLRAAGDAIEIDTSGVDADTVVADIVARVRAVEGG